MVDWWFSDIHKFGINRSTQLGETGYTVHKFTKCTPANVGIFLLIYRVRGGRLHVW